MSKKLILNLVIGLAIFSFVPVAAFSQQLINTNLSATTPTSRFVDNSDGTITDMTTGLMWKKCPEGLSGSDCNYGASLEKFKWQEALQRAQSVNIAGGFAGYTDWRVPNIKELASIVEEQC